MRSVVPRLVLTAGVCAAVSCGEVADDSPAVEQALPPAAEDARMSWVDAREQAALSAPEQSSLEPLGDRDESAEVIAEYLGAIERQDWNAAAELLLRSDVPLGERPDAQLLGVSSYDQSEFAAALASWCETGCITTPPDPSDLSAMGGAYVYPVGDGVIRASYFEGIYGIVGLPDRAEGDADRVVAVEPALVVELAPCPPVVFGSLLSDWDEELKDGQGGAPFPGNHVGGASSWVDVFADDSPFGPELGEPITVDGRSATLGRIEAGLGVRVDISQPGCEHFDMHFYGVERDDALAIVGDIAVDETDGPTGDLPPTQ